MRVTCAMREYVRKAVLAKVADRLKVAEKDKAAAEAARNARIDEAKALCERICAEAQAKFVKEAKKRLGLTFIADEYRWDGVDKGGNRVFVVNVGGDDFAETMDSGEQHKARRNPSAERDEFDRVVHEPERIRAAANAAADRLLFELELGRVARKELDEMLRGLEVEL